MLAERITLYAQLSSTEYFTLDDPVRGELDGAYTLLADAGYDITPKAFDIRVTRGRRSRLNDSISPGMAVIQLYNEDRTFDPTYTGGPYYGQLNVGKRVTLDTDGIVYFDGKVLDWQFRYDVNGRSIATIIATDVLAQLAGRTLDTFTATSQSAGARISAILDRSEVDHVGGRSIDDGVYTLQGDVVPDDTNVLAYLQLVALSDFGYFYASRNNTLTFRDRVSIPISPSLIFGGDRALFHGIEATYTSDNLYGRVTITRAGGTKQVAQSTASRNEFGWRTLTYDGLLHNSNTDSLAMANYLLSRYNTPTFRPSVMVFKIHAYVGQGPFGTNAEGYYALELDIADLISLEWTPNDVGNPAWDGDLVIEGLEHTVSPMQHEIRAYVGDPGNRDFFILDSASFGVLDSNALAF